MNTDKRRSGSRTSVYLRSSASNGRAAFGLLLSILCSWLAAAAAGDVVSLTRGGKPLVLDATRTSPFASLWGRETPQIRNVRQRPERPRARRPVEVTVEAFSDRTDTDLPEVTEVRLFYSTDNGAGLGRRHRPGPVCRGQQHRADGEAGYRALVPQLFFCHLPQAI